LNPTETHAQRALRRAAGVFAEGDGIVRRGVRESCQVLFVKSARLDLAGTSQDQPDCSSLTTSTPKYNRASFPGFPIWPWYPESRSGEDYKRVSPTPNEYEAFLAAISHRWHTQPNYEPEQIGKIVTPTAIASGEYDEVTKREHTEKSRGRFQARGY